jgi:hypothetical protein
MGTTLPARALVTLVTGLTLVTGAAQVASAATRPASTRPGGGRAAAVRPVPGGSRLWLDRFTGGQQRNSIDATLAAGPGGSVVYVTGYTARRAKDPLGTLSTVAYDTSTGARIWTATYHGAGHYHPGGAPLSVVVSPNGSQVFIAEGSFYLEQVLAYNAQTGALMWSGYGGPRHNWPVFLAVSPGSALVYDGANDGRYHFGLKTFDASTGAAGAPSAYTSFKYANDASQIAVTPNGAEVILTGQKATVAYNARTGAQLWRFWDGGRIAISPNSRTVYVAKAKLQPSTNLWYYLTVAYNARTGAKLWAAHYDSRYGTGHTLGAVALSPDGSTLLVTGGYERNQEEVENPVTVAYRASDGSQLWTAGYPGAGAGSSSGQALAVSPDGSRIYELLTTPTGGAVAAYATASGTRLWSVASAERFSSLAVAGDGHSVVVTGTVTNAGGHPVYQTVAYRA